MKKKRKEKALPQRTQRKKRRTLECLLRETLIVTWTRVRTGTSVERKGPQKTRIRILRLPKIREDCGGAGIPGGAKKCVTDGALAERFLRRWAVGGGGKK
jgi:hypothetical protein